MSKISFRWLFLVCVLDRNYWLCYRTPLDLRRLLRFLDFLCLHCCIVAISSQVFIVFAWYELICIRDLCPFSLILCLFFYLLRRNHLSFSLNLALPSCWCAEFLKVFFLCHFKAFKKWIRTTWILAFARLLRCIWFLFWEQRVSALIAFGLFLFTFYAVRVAAKFAYYFFRLL